MAEQNTPGLGFKFRWDLGESTWDTGYNVNFRLLDILLRGNVISATLGAQPGSPTDGDLYLLPTGVTGADWTGDAHKLAYWDGVASGGVGEWIFVNPLPGARVYAVDTGTYWQYNTVFWTKAMTMGAEAGLTAGTPQTQGTGQTQANIIQVSTVTTANDVITLPDIKPGMPISVINDGANALQIYPNIGNDIGAGVNISVSLAPGAKALWMGYQDNFAAQVV